MDIFKNPKNNFQDNSDETSKDPESLPENPENQFQDNFDKDSEDPESISENGHSIDKSAMDFENLAIKNSKESPNEDGDKAMLTIMTMMMVLTTMKSMEMTTTETTTTGEGQHN